MLAAFNRVVFVPKLYLIQPQSPHHGHSHCLPVTFASAPHIGQRILPVFGSGFGTGGSSLLIMPRMQHPPEKPAYQKQIYNDRNEFAIYHPA